jgi:hypothetical protein
MMRAIFVHRPVGNAFLDRFPLNAKLEKAVEFSLAQDSSHASSTHVWREIPLPKAKFLSLEVPWTVKVFLREYRRNDGIRVDQS